MKRSAPWWLKILPLTFLLFCCATPKGRPGHGRAPPRIVQPGRPAPCLPYCVPL